MTELRKKMGRPPKADPRYYHVNVRLNEAELERLVRYAIYAGMKKSQALREIFICWAAQEDK